MVNISTLRTCQFPTRFMCAASDSKEGEVEAWAVRVLMRVEIVTAAPAWMPAFETSCTLSSGMLEMSMKTSESAFGPSAREDIAQIG